MKTRQEVEAKFFRTRQMLIPLIVLSVFNVLLAALDSTFYLLFAATIPMAIVESGLAASGAMAVLIALGIALAVIGLYGLCYWLSKKWNGFMLVALVLFLLDTLYLLLIFTMTFDLGFFLDLIIHAALLYYLVIGTKAWIDLMRLPLVDETMDVVEVVEDDAVIEAISTDDVEIQ